MLIDLINDRYFAALFQGGCRVGKQYLLNVHKYLCVYIDKLMNKYISYNVYIYIYSIFHRGYQISKAPEPSNNMWLDVYNSRTLVNNISWHRKASIIHISNSGLNLGHDSHEMYIYIYIEMWHLFVVSWCIGISLN